MSQVPTPSDALRAAYAGALYEVLAAPQACFRLGPGGTEAGPWLAQLGAQSASILTAWNPFSEARPELENLAAQARLRARIEAAGWCWLPAQGADPAGAWPAEPSLCVLDLPEAALDALLLEFRQYAAVCITAQHGARLHWHPEIRAAQGGST